MITRKHFAKFLAVPRTARVFLVNYPHHGVPRGHNRQVGFDGNDNYLSYLETRIKLSPFGNINVRSDLKKSLEQL